jgi:hypothetical protein
MYFSKSAPSCIFSRVVTARIHLVGIDQCHWQNKPNQGSETHSTQATTSPNWRLFYCDIGISIPNRTWHQRFAFTTPFWFGRACLVPRPSIADIMFSLDASRISSVLDLDVTPRICNGFSSKASTTHVHQLVGSPPIAFFVDIDEHLNGRKW